VNFSLTGTVTSARSGPKRCIESAVYRVRARYAVPRRWWTGKAKRPSGFPEGLSVNRACARGKNLGRVNGLSRSETGYLLLLLRCCFLLGRGLLLCLGSALLRGLSLHRHVCLLAEIGCRFRTPLITGTFRISHPPPITACSIKRGYRRGQQWNAILEIFF